MKILFMGTPDIAAHCLEEIVKSGKHNVTAVFTREDKPVGRKQILTPTAVKIVAQKHGIAVHQPKTLRDENMHKLIKSIEHDIIVVVAYGRILPQDILDIPKHGAINLHVSLLPKYRGAAPIQWAVINGDKETGVTVMQLDSGVDTGDIIGCLPIQIGDDETSGDVFDKVTKIGAEFLCETLSDIENGKITHIPQNHSEASSAPMLSKEDAVIDFEKSASEIHNLVRGMNPWPLAYFCLGDKKVKIIKTQLVCTDSNTLKPGTVLNTKPLTVACKNNAIILHEITPEGSRKMQGFEWAVGKRIKVEDNILNVKI